MHQFSVMQGYPQGMPQYGIPQESINAQSRNLEGMENQSPAPDDSENAEPGAKKKKGAATSMANDAELRRLLQQYQGRTLKEVATEVQRKEGGEGKSEKAKQVFAMLW
jgi:regulatory factor X